MRAELKIRDVTLDILGRSITSRIHNENDKPILNKPKKCSLCRTKGHNHNNCPYNQVDN